MIKKETYKATQVLSLQNSFGVIKEEEVELEVTLAIKDEDYAFFEFYDVETGGDDWYAEGGIWLKGKTVTDYDGVFALPPFITNKLESWGYDTSEL
jgi:hypothetical protein